jgi:XTP/dITP diphosphohydrolase
MKVLLATRNRDKVRELTAIFQAEAPSLEALSLEDFPGAPEVAEDGRTLEENARKKALSGAAATGLWTLADDTGLEVEALGGRPGVLSARFAGPRASYRDNNAKLLAGLRGVEPSRRGAVFRCVMAVASPGGEAVCEEGRLEGRILEEPRGEGGFGYDPLFLVESAGRTLAEMAPGEKNRLSHRARAAGAAVRRLLALAGTAP